MKYRITVEEILPNEKESSKYPDTTEVYQQIVDNLNVPKLATWINDEANQPI
jgi:hypothetical protein